MTNLAKQFFDKTTERIYNALVWGDFEEDKGTFEGAIGRHPKNRLQMSVYEDNSKGKEAITHFKVLERFRYVTLVECQLETGRTHQIRAHMKHFGHTLFNDSRYGGDSILKGTSFSKYRHFIENCFKFYHAKPYMLKHLASNILFLVRTYSLIRSYLKIFWVFLKNGEVISLVRVYKILNSINNTLCLDN